MSLSVSLGLALGALGALLICFIVLFTRRLHARRTTPASSLDWAHRMPRGSAVLARTHPAARITPFGKDGVDAELPRYAHTPGSGMRIAHRGDGGAWYFSRPATPSVLRDVSATSSPVDSYPPFSPFDRHPPSSPTHHPPSPVESTFKAGSTLKHAASQQSHASTSKGYLAKGKADADFGVPERLAPPPPAYTARGREAEHDV